MSIPCLYGQNYFFTIIDDKSWYTWLYPMQNKGEAKKIVIDFFAYVDTQFSAKVKCVHSDNGLEFKMPEFYAKKGVVHQCSCPYTPQQNGVVERKHQHILNVARSLKI